MSGDLILVVDDEASVTEVVSLYLEREGFRTTAVHDGPAALEAAERESPALVVLDLMLPGLNGLETMRRLRAGGPVPIILLTARSQEADRILGLELGADDYIVKPFSPQELVARVRAVLRRTARRENPAEEVPAEIRFHDLVLDPARHRVTVRGRLVGLTRNELRLLETMARAPGRAFSRAELVERAFGWDYEGMERTVDAHVKNLRRKLGARTDGGDSWIETVFGIGYRFVGEPP